MRASCVLFGTWVGALLLVAVVPVGAGAAPCGPGPHWIDTCAAGTDFLSTTAIVSVDINFDDIADITLNLDGPTTIQRQNASDASTNFPGAFGSSLDAHIDAIDTEIVALSLTGSGVTLTAGQGLTPGGVFLDPSLGVVVEDSLDPLVATSFFELFFEVDLGGGVYLYNHTAHQMQETIDQVPPLSGTHVPPGPAFTLLYDAPVGGTAVAQIITSSHTIVPEPESGLLVGLGLLGLARLRRISGSDRLGT